MRHTKQRAAITRVLRTSREHPSAEAIHAAVLAEMPHVSLGTVYRVLNALAEEGQARILGQPQCASRYDGNLDPHGHVVCTRCGRIADVPELLAPSARTEIERWTGFAVAGARLDWYGLCPSCQAAADPSPGTICSP